jgi:hypothetical protein
MKIGDKVEITKLGHCFGKFLFKLGETGIIKRILADETNEPIIMFKLDNDKSDNNLSCAGCKECLTLIKEVKE